MFRHIRVRSTYLLILAIPIVCLRVASTSAETVRVISYNVQFLPGLASIKNKRPDANYRAKQIAIEMSRYEVIGLQEAFTKECRTKILAGIQQQWGESVASLRSPEVKGFMASGGCLALSRWPIVENNAVVFKEYSHPSKYGLRADGFAAKGVIHARIVAQGKPFDLFVTHLEARADAIRPRQYAELSALIQQVSDLEQPAIIMGDMNTRGAKEFRENPESQYTELIEQLRIARPDCDLVDVWPLLHEDQLGGTTEQTSTDEGKRIDYVFVSNPRGNFNRLLPVKAEVLTFADEKVEALSDHNAIAVDLEWVIPANQ